MKSITTCSTFCEASISRWSWSDAICGSVVSLRLRIKTLKLIPSEVGRLITDLQPDIQIPDLENQIRKVIDSLITKEIEIQDKAGRWHSLLMRPYETVDNKISGAILILFDIEESKRASCKNSRPRTLPMLYSRPFEVHRSCWTANSESSALPRPFTGCFKPHPRKPKAVSFMKLETANGILPNSGHC